MPGSSDRSTDHATPGARRRVWSRAWSIAGAALALSLLGAITYLGSWPPLRIVASASMEPAIDTGDVAVIRAVRGTPQVGDVVVVPVPQEIQERYRYPSEVMHRVIEITPDGLVRTQGDNLPEPDPFAVPIASVEGSMTLVIPGVGKAIAFLASPFGIAWLVAGVVVFAVVPFVGTQRDIVYAVEEYGYHLRSHTQILKSMSAASQELSATVVDLRRTLAERPSGGSPPDDPPPEAPAPATQTRRAPLRVVPAARPQAPVPVGPDAMPPGFPQHEQLSLYDDEQNPAVEPIPGRVTHPALLPPDWPRR